MDTEDFNQYYFRDNINIKNKSKLIISDNYLIDKTTPTLPFHWKDSPTCFPSKAAPIGDDALTT